MHSMLARSKNLWAKGHLGIFLLVLAWSCCIFIAFPRGEFPMNDDWSFSLTVKELIENGTYKPLGWSSMPLISHVTWGALFLIQGGFSFEALRISTIVMAAFGIVATYMLCWKASQSRTLALLGASALAFNPIYFALSNQFMTDVPFTAMTAGAAYCFSLNLNKLSSRYYIPGLLLTAASTLNRQLGIAVPTGYALCMVIAFISTRRKSIHPILWILPLLTSATTLLCFESWMKLMGIIPSLYYKQTSSLLQALADPWVVKELAYNSFTGFALIGLFSMPLLTQLSPLSSAEANFLGNRLTRSKLVKVAAFITGFFVFGFIYINQRMPLTGNILYSGGIGPVTMVNGDPRPTGLLDSTWSLFTVLSALGGAIIICYLFFQWVEVNRLVSGRGAETNLANSGSLVSLFYFSCFFLYIAPILIHGFFDRYLIPCLPLLMGWLLATSAHNHIKRQERVALGSALPSSILLIAVFMAFSVLGTRDLFALNRARWSILDQLTKVERISPSQIDGGLEFNGLYLYDDGYKPADDKSWWWVEDDKYILSLSPVDGYTIVRSVPFQRLLPPQDSLMLLLKRSEDTSK